MNRKLRCFTIVLALGLVFVANSVSGVKGGNTDIPATAVFRDSLALGDKIGSDTLGPYSDGVYSNDGVNFYCGSSRVRNSNYFLRTVNYACTPSQNVRRITLDFSNPVSPPAQCVVADPDNTGETLDICGPNSGLNSIPDVRLLAGNLFSSKALTNGTSVILPFSLQPEFTGGADFELDFEQAVSVTAPSSNVRVLTAGSFAVAQLYQMVGTGGRKISLGRFYMPFQLKVTKLQ